MSYPEEHGPYPPPERGSAYAPPPGYPSAPLIPSYEAYPAAPPPPPPGYPYPPPPQPGPVSYQGYFNQGYPAQQPYQQPYQQEYHCEHYHHDHHSSCSSFLRGCLAALCFCCLLEECCF